MATGFWNPFHMAFDVFGRLFAVDNDPDSRPPCRLLHIVEGGDYGYRFRNGRRGLHPFTAWNGELPGTLGMVAGTGEAPSGVIAYESENLPDDYRGTLLVTSWGDHRIEQFRLEPHGATFRSRMKPVVSGGDDFRPVGIAAAPDGALYISDWVDKSYDVHGKGRLWRLRREGSGPPPSRGAQSLQDRRARADAVALKALAISDRIGESAAAHFVKNDSADIRALAADILPANNVNLIEIARTDVSPLVRAAALRRLANPAAQDILLKALEADDPFVQQAARLGLRNSVRWEKLVELAKMPSLAPSQRLGLLLVLRDSGRAEARSLIPSFLADPEPSIHFAAIQWVGEQRLEPFRPQLLAGLASGAVTRGLFEATLAALERTRRQNTPVERRAGRRGVYRCLTQRPADSTLDIGARASDASGRPPCPDARPLVWIHCSTMARTAVATEAVRTLSQSSLPGRFDVLARLAADGKASLSMRAEAIVGLADDAAHQREHPSGTRDGRAADLEARSAFASPAWYPVDRTLSLPTSVPRPGVTMTRSICSRLLSRR